MPKKRLSQIFNDLTFDKKMLGIGSVLMIVSLFLPWYQDLDSFKTGDMFLGVTGPLYLVGLTLLALSVFNLVLMLMDFTGQKINFLPVKSSQVYIFTGIFAFYALIIINSVYFHTKFGVNITLKQSQFGMFTAFIAASFITIGGYLALRDKETILKEFQENTQESFIEVPEQEMRKPKESLNVTTSEHEQYDPVEQIQMPEMKPQVAQEIVKDTSSEIPASVSDDAPPKQEENVQPQSYRMDL